MSMEETYQFDEKTEMDEGQDAMDDIDAFERRMRGEAPVKAPAKPLQARENKPKPAAKPVKKGSEYVLEAAAAVKPPKMTDAQHDAAEAISAVSDLDKFDQRHPQ
eukprot:CAMPEP_0119056908 /NCGR_PEP_ID=MMETSP1178-20130426/1475_1 /TAXON_ID=33656 /ORGANISM="unid sp, Strain CCMP2000" /LENGTH=104 /DNA_ID=CAMNT_0007037689 /DNA_START=25 /DNA_END=342 /DNA_ORIENTATION=-